MRRVKKLILGLIVGFLLTNSVTAQKTKYQSIFIYNFSKYIKWPDDFNEGKFVIGVHGNSEIQNDLESMVATKKQTSGLVMEVKIFSSLSDLSECNLLFITSKFCNRIQEIQHAILGVPTLIVTDKSGMAKKGAAINFIEKDGKIKFELNQSTAESLGLRVSSSLVSLAILI